MSPFPFKSTPAAPAAAPPAPPPPTQTPSTEPSATATPADRISKKQDLDFIRDRLSALDLSHSRAERELAEAHKKADQALLWADLSPASQPLREAADHAVRIKDSAMSDRDSIAESMGRLRKCEAELSAAMAQAEGVSLAEAKVASRAANLEAIWEGAEGVRVWAARILVEYRVSGGHAGDLGLALIEHLTGVYRSTALFGDRAGKDAVEAEVGRMLRIYESGGAL
jgi:hypothetical protein